MTEHDRFESAYREYFPVASSMQSDLFERDDDGYIEAKVYTAFTLWKAASATPADHSVPVATYFLSSSLNSRPVLRAIRGAPALAADREHILFAAPQLPQNAADHIVDANKKVSAVAYATAELDRVQTCASLADMPKSVKATYTVALGVIGGDAQSVRDAWISVDERLPDFEQAVLIAWDHSGCIDEHHHARMMDSDGWLWYDCAHGTIGEWDEDEKPTHWQPLPQPPKGQS